MPQPSDSAVETQQERLKAIVRDRIKPVPNIKLNIIDIYGSRVVVAEIPFGPDRPYSIHDNKVFVRKGATNWLADPHNELSKMRRATSIPWTASGDELE